MNTPTVKIALVIAGAIVTASCSPTEPVATVSTQSEVPESALADTDRFPEPALAAREDFPEPPQTMPPTSAEAAEMPSPQLYAPEEEPPRPIRTTRVLDEEALDRLRNNSGITLQWIGWDERGKVRLIENDAQIEVFGAQYGAQGTDQRVLIGGRVVEIGVDYFILDGMISIRNAPNDGRLCREERANWRFAVTQNRKYWRLREFEWCDGLTDYIDIYF